MRIALHWFRRDLRITDNTALTAAIGESEQVIPTYILSHWKKQHRWTGPNRQYFLCGCLESLSKNLATLGGRLVIRQGEAVEELEKLIQETKAEAIFFNRDPDPFGRTVEERLRESARRLGVIIRDFKDVCIHEGNDVLTANGTPFRVYTPYAKAWAKLPRSFAAGRAKRLHTPDDAHSLDLPTLKTWQLGGAAPGILEAGEKAARGRMKKFLEKGLEHYSTGRNFPGGDITSRLSQDLRFGLISIRELFSACENRALEFSAPGRNSALKFLAELIWREFYMQILWHFPEVLDVEFNPKFRGMSWPGAKEHFERWCAGETGFPIVDAAMRQLNNTGFMHNRLRMITAMFLTKDLHIDWRWGESYFMQKLRDGEIASNNGGWQWSAGTGADAAPYFRIQNPWTQTQRYDPQGTYIKTWLPALRDVAPEKFYTPPASGQSLVRNYPPPVVDHATARNITLNLFEAVKK